MKPSPNQAMQRTVDRSHDAVIRVYDAAGNVIATQNTLATSKNRSSLFPPPYSNMKHAYPPPNTAYPYISTITVKYFAASTLVNGM